MRGLVRVEASQSCRFMRLGAENRGWGGGSAASGRGTGAEGAVGKGATILKPNQGPTTKNLLLFFEGQQFRERNVVTKVHSFDT